MQPTPARFRELHASGTFIVPNPWDVGSARVLEKNGFVEEGRLRCAVRKRGRLHDLRVFGRVDSGTG